MTGDMPTATFAITGPSPTSRGWLVVQVTCPHCSDQHDHAWDPTEKHVWRRPPCDPDGPLRAYWLAPGDQAQAWLAARAR